MENRKDKINQAITELLEIPKDLVMDLPKLTIIGQEELYLENHKGIIEYDVDRIRVNLPRGFLEIRGTSLEIKAIFPEEIRICGHIQFIRYHE